MLWAASCRDTIRVAAAARRTGCLRRQWVLKTSAVHRSQQAACDPCFWWRFDAIVILQAFAIVNTTVVSIFCRRLTSVVLVLL